MKIIAIDPGPQQSAWLVYDMDRQVIDKFGIEDNKTLLARIKILKNDRTSADKLIIEMVAHYGMPVGREVFETCVWIGRFIQAWGRKWAYVYRKDVKMQLCRSMQAKDTNIRRALIDRFGPGREKAIGKKNKTGPLYEIKKDVWSALAVAVTYAAMLAGGSPME